MIACGYLEERASDQRVTASEFEVFRCGTDQAILTFDALQTCALEAEPTGLRFTELTRWPFGVDWAWVDAPLWEYTVSSNPDLAIGKRFVLGPPELTAEQVETTLADYVSMRQHLKPSTPDSGAIEELIGRTLAVALTGNPQGRRNLEATLDELGLDGHGAEVYFEAFEIYQSYAKETGKVPPIR